MRGRRPAAWRCAIGLAALGAAAFPPSAGAFDPASPYGVCAGPASPALWDAVREAGIAWTRSDFSWRMVEGAGKGQFDWSITDSEVAETNARGIHIVGDFSYSPAWASGNGDQRNPPANPQDWYDYVFAVVTRYKASVHHWELWNEPNLSIFFTGTLQQYIDVIFKVGADAVHAADPTAKVVGPELFGGTGSSNPAWMRAVLQQAGDKLDIVSFHQYGGGDVPSGRLAAIDTMRNLIVSEGYGNRDIWITECGWHDAQLGGDQQLQGQYLADMLDGMAARSAWFKKFFWYQIWEGLPPDELWGLCRQDETRKPVWFRYRDYIAATPWGGGGGGNQPPTVSLLTPADGATFTTPCAITALATAADPDGTVAKVEFFSETTLLGEDADGSNGYGFTVGGVPAGSYAVTARATDNTGAATTSTAVNITVNGGGAAVLTLNAKPAGAIAVDGNPGDWNLAEFITTARGGQAESGDIALVGYAAGTLYHAGDATDASLPTAGTDHTANAYARHDATYLYFLVRVDDSDLQTSSATSMNWLNDCVEIYLDPANAGGAAALDNSTSDIQLVIDAANRQNVYMTTAAYGAQALAGVTSAVSTDGAGWWLEVRIQKSALSPAIPAGGTIGVEFNHRDNDADNDSAQTTVYSWSDTERSNVYPSKIPDRWGDLVLSGTPPPPPPNQSPAVSLTSPASGQTFTAPATVNLAANASDPDGTVARVEFFQGGAKLGEDAAASDGFTFSWADVAAGSYSLTARATDNAGAATTSTAVSITVNPASGGNQPPTVSLTSPTNGQTFTAPATVNLAANASDSDGAVARVEFVFGTTILATDTAGPFSFTWSNVAAGNYTLTARATDNAGAVTTSSAVTITVSAAGGGGAGDADGDGLSDAWETQYFGNVSQTAGGDPDADGQTNLQEYTAGTNPTLADTDGDGMKDGGEATWGFNPLIADQDGNGVVDGLDDWNANGVNNQTEVANATNPGNPPAGGGGGGGSGGCWGAASPGYGAIAPALWVLLLTVSARCRGRRRRPG